MMEAEPDGPWWSLQRVQAPAAIIQIEDLSQAAETIREAIVWIGGIDPGSPSMSGSSGKALAAAADGMSSFIRHPSWVNRKTSELAPSGIRFHEPE